MIYPLVRELAGDGIPVAVTCRVLKLARQPYYRWLAASVSDQELEQAHLMHALFLAHRDDPEFGYRLIGGEARAAGFDACDRTMWRLCAGAGWWSVFGKRRPEGGKRSGPPAHDDLVLRNFTAPAPDRLWLTDITEHPVSSGGKLYLCAVRDVFSNRIVGYSMSDRMTSQLAVDALTSAVARRARNVAGLHDPLGPRIPSNFVPKDFSPRYANTGSSDRWARSPPRVIMRPWSRSSHSCRTTC